MFNYRMFQFKANKILKKFVSVTQTSLLQYKYRVFDKEDKKFQSYNGHDPGLCLLVCLRSRVACCNEVKTEQLFRILARDYWIRHQVYYRWRPFYLYVL